MSQNHEDVLTIVDELLESNPRQPITVFSVPEESFTAALAYGALYIGFFSQLKFKQYHQDLYSIMSASNLAWKPEGLERVAAFQGGEVKLSMATGEAIAWLNRHGNLTEQHQKSRDTFTRPGNIMRAWMDIFGDIWDSPSHCRSPPYFN